TPPPPPPPSPLSLHDALPISFGPSLRISAAVLATASACRLTAATSAPASAKPSAIERPNPLVPPNIRAFFPSKLRYSAGRADWRSEEHTSELQSRFDLVCRLL